MRLTPFALLGLCICSSDQYSTTSPGSSSGQSTSPGCGVIPLASRPHPWIARLGYWKFNGNGASGPMYTRKWLCGGSLITSTAVVTAAHCVAGALNIGRQLFVRLGEMDTTSNSGREQTIFVSTITLHPSYSTNTRSHHHDIAVLRLSKAANFSSYVNTICLAQSTLVLNAGQNVRLAGWGLVSFTSATLATQLKNPTRKILPLSSCTSAYPPHLRNAFYPGGLGTNQLCVASGQTVPICKGDSGGPVVWFMPGPNRHILVGVISVGIGCGASFPGINTRVAPYANWILQVI